MNYVEIVLENKSRVTDQIYTYKYRDEDENDIQIGKRVVVPFGRGDKKKLGIIVGKPKEYNLNYELKYITEIIDNEPIVSQDLIDLAFFMRDNYLSDLSSAFQTILPPGNWKDLEKVFFLKDDNAELSDELKKYLKKPRKSTEIISKFENTNIEKLLNEKIIGYKYIIRDLTKVRKVTIIELNKDFDTSTIRKNAIAQNKVLEYLKVNNIVEQSILLRATGTTSSVIKSLENKNAVKISEEISYTNVIKNNEIYKKIDLNYKQNNVYSGILNNENNFSLIHGVTGSGKTEIYLHLTEKILKDNRTAIILVPEISLTPQTIERFSGRFPNKVAVLHSKLSPSEKLEQWQQIENGDYKIVVGARSAIFAPVKNLGLIVIDEEHDTSYFSESNPKYNAIEIAEYRSKLTGAKLVLGSATPSIESYYKARKKIYNLYHIDSRATNSSLPNVSIVDMRMELKNGNISIFSNDLKEAVEDNLKNGNQSILFLNKRGHTSYIFCRRCGHVEICSHCDVAMTYHKNTNRLVCHHCGRTKYKPRICPNCGSKYIKEFGAGTEKLEEECRILFPDARIYRIDGDNNSEKDSYTKLYEKMKNNEIDILIGTQMITKGFDFENVTLVGIIAADISLNMGDYKASEKTFQLLTQVSGRAGRGENPGKVFIQTYKPEHYSIITSRDHDYESFYNMEIDYRRMFKYPPFYKLINIKLSGVNRAQTRLKLMEVAKYIQNYIMKGNIKDIEIVGPTPSPIGKINNYYRFDINLKLNKGYEDIIDIIKIILIENKFKINFNGFKLSLTLNPISFY